MESDGISFSRIGRDGLTAEMRRSGHAWIKLVAEFGESVHYRLVVARAVASEMHPSCMLDGILDIAHELAGIFIMTTDGFVK